MNPEEQQQGNQQAENQFHANSDIINRGDLDAVRQKVGNLEQQLNTHSHLGSDNTSPLPTVDAIFRTKPFTSGDATPSVRRNNIFDTVGTTAITNFSEGKLGQIIFIRAQSTITITHNASKIVLENASNFDMVSGDTLTLCMFEDQIWHEVSRSLVTAANIDVQEFTSSGTWTKPAGAKYVEVFAFGAGGGGGSGGRHTVGNTGAGAGGSGGAFVFKRIVADALSSSETVTVGIGGAGGSGVSADGDGNAGLDGGNSDFGITILLVAPGGKGGTKGTAPGSPAGGAAVQGNGFYTELSGAGGDASDSATGESGESTSLLVTPRGGGAGGGNGTVTGGTGGGFTNYYNQAGGAAGGAGSGSGHGGAGGSVTALDLGLLIGGVGGGGGGGTSGSFTSGAGGAGQFPGGGGGGSGIHEGTGSGATGDGGDGANGAVVVITYK